MNIYYKNNPVQPVPLGGYMMALQRGQLVQRGNILWEVREYKPGQEVSLIAVFPAENRDHSGYYGENELHHPNQKMLELMLAEIERLNIAKDRLASKNRYLENVARQLNPAEC